MGRRGRPDWIRRHRRLRMFCLRSYALLGTAGDTGPDGGLRAIGRSRGGAARRNAVRHRRPQAQPGLRTAARATAEAARHNATKPHRLRTYRDAGRARASGAAGRSMHRAGASTSRHHGPRTRKESRASSGPEERHDHGAITRTSDKAE